VKIVKRIGLVLLGLFLLLSAAIFIVLRFYEDEIGTYAVRKLKSQVKTQFDVADVSLAFWKTFPNASVELNDVFVQELGERKDTLLFAKALFLKFNLWDVVRGKYSVDKVEVTSGILRLEIDEAGQNNWEVWSETQSDTSNFEIELEEISLTDTRVIYYDRPNRFLMDALAIQTSGNGNFSARNMDVDLTLDLFMERLISKDESYLEKQLIAGEVVMHADLDKDSYAFEPGEMTCGDFRFAVGGSIGGNGVIDFLVEAKDQTVEDAIDILPASIRKTLFGYRLSGDFSGKAVIGCSKETDPVMVDVDLDLTDGELRIKDEGIALEDITTDFHYVRGGKKDRIQVRSFSCSLDGSEIEASGSIVGFEAPILDLKVKAGIELKDIRDFFDLKQIELCEGSLTAEAALNGTLRYIAADTSYNWREVLATGRASVMDASLKMRNSNRVFNEMNADFTFDKQSANIIGFAGKVNGSDFALTGSLHNIVSFLFEPQARIFLDADLKSRSIDFTQLVEEETSTSTESDYELLFPPLLDFNLNCSIDKFVFRKFEASGVKGVASLNQGKLTVDPVTFSTASGNLSAQLILAPISATAYRMNCLAEVKGIHIDEVFTEFENFGQTFIQDRHLKGTADANVQFRAVLTNSLELPSDQIESVVDVSIENGELNNFETLQEIADYLRSNKWVAPFVDEDRFAERMRNVKFSKLQNVIEIRNRIVTIPLMDIRSSAMDISAKGTHTFDHAIEYAVGFNLRDLLVRKDKEWTEQDDGLGKSMYISMKGTVDNPVYAVDKELAKEVRKEAMEAERQNVKALLKDELGLFKKDASVGNYKEGDKKDTEATITVDWEENNAGDSPPPKEKERVKSDVKTAEPEKPSDKKKKTPKWLEEKD
jgi:hypothetical protein